MAEPEREEATGLTPDLFKKHPTWSKQAFAYRLLCILAPPAITKRLQRHLIGGIIFPGLGLPADFIPPPGFVVPPGFSFPPGWKIGDPWPPGLFPPGFNWDEQSGDFASISSMFLNPWQPAPNYISGVAAGVTTYEIYAEPGDGHVYISRATWSAAHDATDGSSFNITDTADTDCIMASKVGVTYPIRRSFFIFDLSSIPSGSIVQDVSLFIRGFGYAESNVCVQQGTQAASLSTADFDAFTGNYFRQTLWTTGDNTLAFNAAGVAYIQSVLASSAKLCLREYYQDYLNVAPTVQKRCGCYFTNTGTVARRPRLSVSYI